MEDRAAALEALARLMTQGRSMVYFGGAGTSTESDIPDFRSKEGLYNTPFRYREPEYLLSIACLQREPELFYAYLRAKLHCPWARPSGAHLTLARLEARGVVKAVITQNIDSLHQAAGKPPGAGAPRVHGPGGLHGLRGALPR